MAMIVLKTKPLLLSRDQFRNGVFERDGYKCVVCGEPAADAHHIMERRLFPDGGYYIDNGASLCPIHHIEAEKTNLSTEYIREMAGITNIILPPHMYHDIQYDKWGNVFIGQRRTKGELFHDESVQKILAESLHLFTDYVKYPRTYHLPFSPGVTKDDRVLADTSCFDGEDVVITEKRDGENTTMYCDHIHARSLDSQNHYSRNWVKNFHSSIAHDIPSGWRVCGENLYAKHSIGYDELDTYFEGFSVWNEKNQCLSWADTLDWFHLLGIKPVPAIYNGLWDERLCRDIKQDPATVEGYVVRLSRSFDLHQFNRSVAKFVRHNHVQTHGHWMREAVVKNELKHSED